MLKDGRPPLIIYQLCSYNILLMVTGGSYPGASPEAMGTRQGPWQASPGPMTKMLCFCGPANSTGRCYSQTKEFQIHSAIYIYIYIYIYVYIYDPSARPQTVCLCNLGGSNLEVTQSGLESRGWAILPELTWKGHLG